MRRYSYAVFMSVSVLSFLFMNSCAKTTPPPAAQPEARAAAEKAILDGEKDWAAEWKSRDLEKIVGHYAADAIVMEPGMPAMKGKDAINSDGPEK